VRATKDVSVIVSTYTKERFQEVYQCIGSLKNQKKTPLEIILVLDPIDELVEFYRSQFSSVAKIAVSDKFGLSAARNKGVRIARGEIVAFIDDDATADENWLERLLVNYDDPDVIGVGGRIDPNWEEPRPFWFPEELDWVFGCSYRGQESKRRAIRNPIGCNMSFRRSVFDEVGFFRSDIGRFGNALLCDEDTEFSVRALDKIQNSRIMYEPLAVVHHNVGKKRARLKYLWKRSFYEGLSKAMISTSSVSSEILSTENVYLKYLFSVSIPSRLKKFYKIEHTAKILALLLSTFAVFAGFFTGRISERV
jgi:glycosyltransferase involved in cell wall biosynthesis